MKQILEIIRDKDSSLDMRTECIQMVGNLHIRSGETISALLDILEDAGEHHSLKVQTLRTMQVMGYRSHSFLSMLRRITRESGDYQLPLEAAFLLAQYYEFDESILELLQRLLPDKQLHYQTRKTCLEIVDRLMDWLGALIPTLTNVVIDFTENIALREHAMQILATMRVDDPAFVSFLQETIEARTADFMFRENCVHGMGMLRNLPADNQEWVFHQIRNTAHEAQIRIFLARVLFYYPHWRERVALYFHDVIKNREENVFLREHGVVLLGNINFNTPETIELLVSIFKNNTEDLFLREKCVITLGRFTLFDPQIAEAIISVIEDESQDTTFEQNCIYALGRFNVPHPQIIRYLRRTFSDPNAPLLNREKALFALSELRYQDESYAFELLKSVLNNNIDTMFRRTCVVGLGKMGWKHPRIIRALFDLITDRTHDMYLRYDALRALELFQLRDPHRRQQIYNIANDETEPSIIRKETIRFLARNDQMDDTLLELLLPLIEKRHPDPDLLETCIDVLRNTLPKDDRVYQVLQNIVEDTNLHINLRVRSAHTLSDMGMTSQVVNKTLANLYL